MNVAVRYACLDQEPLALAQANDIQQEDEDDSHVNPILLDERQAELLVKSPLARFNCKTLLLESFDDLREFALVFVKAVEETKDEVFKPLFVFRETCGVLSMSADVND